MSLGHVDSERFPIRVHFPSRSRAALATTLLAEAEHIWDRVVLQMGFDPPMITDATGLATPGLEIWLDIGSADPNTVPVAPIHETLNTDCTSSIILPTDPTEDDLVILMALEIMHAIEMAMDCIETESALESTAVAATVLLHPRYRLWLSRDLPVFQSSPHLSVACSFPDDPGLSYYHHGAALFLLFLDEWLGDGDGQLLSRFWRATQQAGWIEVIDGDVYSTVINNPNLVGAISIVLEEESISFEEAFAQFAVWRYTVGARDDGAHFEHGSLWMGGEVTVDTTHILSELPIGFREPRTRPSPFGTTYLEMDVRELEPHTSVVFSFSAGSCNWSPWERCPWHVDALRVTQDGSIIVENLPLDTAGDGEFWHRDLAGVSRLVWAISNLGRWVGDFSGTCGEPVDQFSYSLRAVDMEAVPHIDELSPYELLQGSSQLVTVFGADFQQGIIAYVDGEGAAIQGDTLRLDDFRLCVKIHVAEDAVPGPRTLYLANPNGHWTRDEEAFTIIAQKPPPPPSAVSCYCQGENASTSSGSGLGSAFLGLLVLLALLSIQRRRVSGR